MDKQKVDWLKQIGAEELNPPHVIRGKAFKYRVPLKWKDDYMYYSEEYLNQTPLDEIKNRFESWCDFWRTFRSTV